MSANARLCRQYGTAGLSKEGSFPLAAKIALAMLNLELMDTVSGEHGVEKGRQETAQALEQEAERMAPVTSGLHMKHGAEKLAQLSGQVMAKVAFGDLVSSAAGGVAKTVLQPKVLAVGGLAAGLYTGSKLLGAMAGYRRGPQRPALYGAGKYNPMRTGITEYGY